MKLLLAAAFSLGTLLVAQPASALSASIDSWTNVSCNGGATGSMTASVSGPFVGPLTYQWKKSSVSGGPYTNIGSTALTANGLNATDYYIFEVTDAGTAFTALSEEKLLTQPTALDITFMNTPPACGGDCDGSITASITGGTPGYIRSWSTGSSAATITNQCAGIQRTLTVEDANGCMHAESTTLTAPPALGVTVGTDAVACSNDCDGSLGSNVTGGTAPYTYLWSNGQTSDSGSGLCAGTYTVYVTDASGCEAEDSGAVTAPAALAVIVDAEDAQCNGECNGSASAGATGGTAPYTYLWNTGATTGVASALCAGLYEVTVTDANGCETDASDVVEAPAALSVTVDAENAQCNGECSGDASAGAIGGTAPYTYLWSNGDTTAASSELCAGMYSVIVTDANGCDTMEGTLISEPTALDFTFDTSNVNCNGDCDGASDVTATGGSPPYLYLWSNGTTDAAETDLCPGSYSVTVTDSNGCEAMHGTVVTEPAALGLSFETTPATCNGDCDATATVAVTGGTEPYDYDWSSGSAVDSDAGLCADTYSVTVTDSLGCELTDQVSVGEPAELLANGDSTNSASCESACNGTASVSPSGGTAPYSTVWGEAVSTENSLSDLCVGDYVAVVTDSNGCQVEYAPTIAGQAQPDAPTVTATPNPAVVGETVQLSAVGADGATYEWSGPDGFTSTDAEPVLLNVTQNAAGTYTVSFEDGACTSLAGTVTLTVEDAPVPDAAVGMDAAVADADDEEDASAEEDAGAPDASTTDRKLGGSNSVCSIGHRSTPAPAALLAIGAALALITARKRRR